MIELSPPDARLVERFAHHAGKGINRFGMIGPGDRILIGVSGGKDSLALSLALVARKKWVPIDYELFALHVDWTEYPWSREEKDAVDGFFDSLGIPLRRIQASIAPKTFKKRFSCYTCARNRKRILFDEAGRLGARSIALAHHMDDIARTTLMNVFFRGEFSTMMPVQEFFGGKLKVIRPLCEVRETEVQKLATRLSLPVVPSRCPNSESNQRTLMKEIIRQVSRVNKHATTNIYGSAWRVNTEYLPSAETGGVATPDTPSRNAPDSLESSLKPKKKPEDRCENGEGGVL